MNASPRVRSAWLHLRCTPALKSQIRANASASKMPITEYVENVLTTIGVLAPRLHVIAGGRVVVARLGSHSRPWAVYVDGVLIRGRRKSRVARFATRAEAERKGELVADRTEVPARRFA